MQTAGSARPFGHRLRIGYFVIAVLAAALQPLAQAHAAGTLDRVRQAGKLTLGYRADAQLFSYRDEAGKPEDYSVAICAKVAERVKMLASQAKHHLALFGPRGRVLKDAVDFIVERRY